MNKAGRIAIVTVLVLAVACVMAMKYKPENASTFEVGAQVKQPVMAMQETAALIEDSTPVSSPRMLPRMVDLGAKSCLPCKMMAPILEDLMRNYQEYFVTEFIDVWENQQAARQYGIRVIPTQIFFDAEGKERFRHEGFMSKADILNRWKALGITVPEEGQG